MYKRINIFLGMILFFLSTSVLANEDVDWSVFSAWCPLSIDVCAEKERFFEMITSSETIDPQYHFPNKNDTRLFSELLPVYETLLQSKSTPDLTQYISWLKKDLKSRQQLLRYIADDTDIPKSSRNGELRHYRKELMYIKSMQEINQKQKQLLGDEQKYATLKTQVTAQANQLDDALSTIKEQLNSDVDIEKQILRYFVYRKEQIDESKM